jgi:uncharacterized integral membrane protein
MTTLNKVKLITIAIVAVLTVIIVFQNTDAVDTKILFLTITMPRAALLFGTLVIGFVIGLLTASHFAALPAKRDDVTPK